MKKYSGSDLSKYKASFLECRPGMSGHRWRWQTDFKILRNTKGEIVEFSRRRVCTRCEAEMVKVYDGKTGRVVRKSGYHYEDGYLIDSKALKYEPGMAALELLHRAMEAERIEDEEP